MDATRVATNILPILRDEEVASLNNLELPDSLNLNGFQDPEDILLTICVHFTPEKAISIYKGGDTRTEEEFSQIEEPYIMIERYLISDFDLDEELARDFASELGHLWENWFKERDVAKKELKKKKLLKDQGYKCANCNAELNRENKSRAYQNKDILKPIHRFGRDQLKAEIDHKEPISSFGGNEMENLQLLCRFCNQGKGAKGRTSIYQQLKYSCGSISSIKASHRRSLFYSVTAEYNKCQECGSNKKELSLKLRKDKGPYVESNLKIVCVDCKFS